MLCAKTWPNWVGMPKEGLKELLKVMYVACSKVLTIMWSLLISQKDSEPAVCLIVSY